MNTDDALKFIDTLITKAESVGTDNPEILGIAAQAREFFRVYVGERSEFYNAVFFLDEKAPNAKAFISILKSFKEYVCEGFSIEFTPLEQAQVNVVSDFLSQAQLLLQDKKVHPATACIVAGAALEEYLRNWAERLSLKLGNRKPSIIAYSDILTQNQILSKQDAKDIVAWGGIRNEAAHGNWADLEDRARAKIMLEGINLFMRKNSNVAQG